MINPEDLKLRVEVQKSGCTGGKSPGPENLPCEYFHNDTCLMARAIMALVNKDEEEISRIRKIMHASEASRLKHVANWKNNDPMSGIHGYRRKFCTMLEVGPGQDGGTCANSIPLISGVEAEYKIDPYDVLS